MFLKLNSFNDVDKLVLNQSSENHYLEYKSADILKEAHAKEKILKEISAFANADGGVLVIGIDEDEENRARSLSTFSDCSLHAQRIQQWSADNVEPPISTIKSDAHIKEGDKGVIVVTIPSSITAPHRLRLSKGQSRYNRHVFVRRNRDSIPMTMLEIQDLVRLRDRGASDIESRFESWRQEQIKRKQGNVFSGAGYNLQFLAVQAIKSDCDIEEISPTFYLDDGYKVLGKFFEWLYAGCSNKRVLRGIEYYTGNRSLLLKKDGSVKLEEKFYPESREERILTIGRITTLFIIAAINALNLRMFEGSAIYISCSVLLKHLNGVGPTGGYDVCFGGGITEWMVRNFPIYEIRGYEDLEIVTHTFMEDLFHHDGREVSDYQDKIIFPLV